MKKYAITTYPEREFYPDPIYEDIEKAREKVKYLIDYKIKNNIPLKSYCYCIETLTPAREKQHNEEWQEWCSMID